MKLIFDEKQWKQLKVEPEILIDLFNALNTRKL